jgi:hypothetical protein
MTTNTTEPWRFTAGQQTGVSGGASFSLLFTGYQDIDATTGEGVSPPGGYNSITSNSLGLGIGGGANANFIGNTAGPDGEEGIVFGIDATGLPVGTQLRIAKITLQQTGTNTFNGNDSVAVIRRTAPAAIATTTLGSVENPLLSQTIDLTNLDITVAGGSEIPECLTIFNATDGSQRGFRVQSIGLEISNAPPTSASIQLTDLEQTYNSSPLAAAAITSPAGLDVQILYTIPGQAFPTTNPPAAVGSYPVTANIITPGFTGSTSGTFIISKATGLITFSSLIQSYDGTPRTVTASSSPPANMVIDYGGSTTAPIAVGSYPVTATINDPNVEGSASAQLLVQKGSATVLANSIIRTANGNPVPGEATTTPPGLALEFLYNGIPTAPSLPGSYPYTATISDPNREGQRRGHHRHPARTASQHLPAPRSHHQHHHHQPDLIRHLLHRCRRHPLTRRHQHDPLHSAAMAAPRQPKHRSPLPRFLHPPIHRLGRSRLHHWSWNITHRRIEQHHLQRPRHRSRRRP